jgi:putative ABC transport system permease protein
MLIQLNFTQYGNNDAGTAKIRTFHDRVLERVKAEPGVIEAAFALTFPLNEQLPLTGGFEIEGRARAQDQPKPTFDFRVVSPGYFQTIGIPLIRGRFLSDRDGPDAPGVVVINEAMARHCWENDDPLGHRLSGDDGKTWATVVGVIGDVRQYGLDKPAKDELYVTQSQNPTKRATLLVRARQNPLTLVRNISSDVHAIDPEQPIAQIRTLEQLRQQSLASPRLTSFLLGLFAFLALVITAAGIAGVMGLYVTQRIKEIGIRMALGATRGSVLRLVLNQGLVRVAIGLVLGVIGAVATTHFMSSLLFGVEPNDPPTLVSVTLLLLAVAAAACYGPALRATSVDPLNALRSE